MEDNKGRLKLYEIFTGKTNILVVAESSRGAIKKFFNNIENLREDFEEGVLGKTLKISSSNVSVSYEVLPMLVVLGGFSKKEGVNFLMKTGVDLKTSALLINILVEKYRWIEDNLLEFRAIKA